MVADGDRYKNKDGVLCERFYCVYLQDANKPEDAPPEVFFVSRSDAIALEYLVLGLPKEGVIEKSAELLTRARRFSGVPDLDQCIKKEYLTPEKILEFEKLGIIL